MISNEYFEYAMLFLILVSSLELCFDDATVEPGSTKRGVLYVFDIFFTITFGLEASDIPSCRLVCVLCRHNCMQSIISNGLIKKIERRLIQIHSRLLKIRAQSPALIWSVPHFQAMMKILVFGLLFNGPHSYLRGPWNILDIFVVIVNVMVLVLQSVLNDKNIIWLRAFRAFRCS